MSEYTPTTDEVRIKYRLSSGQQPGDFAEFDRWLAEVRAQALRDAADEIETRRNTPGLVRLDVQYAGFYTGIRSGMESDVKALRVKADEQEATNE